MNFLDFEILDLYEWLIFYLNEIIFANYLKINLPLNCNNYYYIYKMINSRLSIQIHILSLLALNQSPITSELIASSANCNPVLIRKELSILKKAGLVNTIEGKNGGASLAVSAHNITLDILYKIVYEDQEVFSLNKNAPNPNCIVGKNINTLMTDINKDAELALLNTLNGFTIQNLIDKI
jgi:DNA-binding IscR family transcriptional regulator